MKLRETTSISDMQFVFRLIKTADTILIVRLLREKMLEGSERVYMCFKDMKKWYDKVPRKIIRYSLKKKEVTKN